MFRVKNRGEEPGEWWLGVSCGHREGECRGLSLASQGLPCATQVPRKKRRPVPRTEALLRNKERALG